MRTPRRVKPSLEFFHSTSRTFPSRQEIVCGLKLVILRGAASFVKTQISLGDSGLWARYAVVFPLVLKLKFPCDWITSASLRVCPLALSTVKRACCVPSTVWATRYFESGVHSRVRTLP